jgi:hypothetical protein
MTTMTNRQPDNFRSTFPNISFLTFAQVEKISYIAVCQG